MTRYKLPEALGGGEVMEYPTTVAVPTNFLAVGFVEASSRDDGWLYIIPKQALTEVPPPIPDEPEPGAYLIGGVLVVGTSHDDWWVPTAAVFRDVFRYDWFRLWAKYGGPDVTAVPLVPAPSDVELPWKGTDFANCDVAVRVSTMSADRVKVHIPRDGLAHEFSPNVAERMAAALSTAARKARQS